ncbi:MAG: Rrf2 family transcriptional regulator [Nitrospirae bacterium]|nr:Rrf2 family transcriptional regulator [Nitrospirota bacterium]
MLKLTKKVDYGLLAIAHIAGNHGEGVVNTKEIAETYSIPVELLAKILQRLVKFGLISSLSGPKGGYSLSINPSEITVAQIINALEGDISILGCIEEDDHKCYQFERCNIRTPMQKLEYRILNLLHKTTLEELLESYVPKPV